MKHFVKTVVALSLLALSPSARAQAQANQAPEPMPASAHPWSGCLVGVNLAYGRSHTDLTSVNKPGAEFGSETDDNVLGGGQVGCDRQIGSWVVGVGGGVDFGGLAGSHAIPTFPTFIYKNSVPWVVTATVRGGYAVRDDVLVYVRGGGAWMENDIKVDGPRMGLSESATDNRFGWTVGVGAEYRFVARWSAFVEYNYLDFGKKKVSFTPAPNTVGGEPDVLDITQTMQTLLIGASYRF